MALEFNWLPRSYSIDSADFSDMIVTRGDGAAYVRARNKHYPHGKHTVYLLRAVGGAELTDEVLFDLVRAHYGTGI